MLLLSRLKRDGNAVGLEVDGVALGVTVWQQAATLEPQACLMGMARMGTMRQFRPMRSSPLLQQAIFWPLPHLGAPDWESTST